MLVTVACGAISGFHSTQAPMVSKCITDEKVGHKVFYGAMIMEAVIALIWAAAGVAFYGGTNLLMNAIKDLGQFRRKATQGEQEEQKAKIKAMGFTQKSCFLSPSYDRSSPAGHGCKKQAKVKEHMTIISGPGRLCCHIFRYDHKCNDSGGFKRSLISVLIPFIIPQKRQMATQD